MSEAWPAAASFEALRRAGLSYSDGDRRWYAVEALIRRAPVEEAARRRLAVLGFAEPADVPMPARVDAGRATELASEIVRSGWPAGAWWRVRGEVAVGVGAEGVERAIRWAEARGGAAGRWGWARVLGGLTKGI